MDARQARRTTQPTDQARQGRDRSVSVRQLAGPATVGGLVAASAYMIHGLFPILATEYAGLDTAEAGIVYTLSAGAMLVIGPLAGGLVDRFGPAIGLTWRPIANVGSSLLYLIAPSFAGFTAARLVDDSGKAAFRPAWAATAAAISAQDPERRGKRLGILDGGQSAGEAVGPLIATVLWQTGGVSLLLVGRIVLAIAGELAAIRVFGEAQLIRDGLHRMRRRAKPSHAADPGPDDLRRHDLRGHLTVIRGEIELVLAGSNSPDEDRKRSVTRALAALDRATDILASTGTDTGADESEGRQRLRAAVVRSEVDEAAST